MIPLLVFIVGGGISVAAWLGMLAFESEKPEGSEEAPQAPPAPIQDTPVTQLRGPWVLSSEVTLVPTEIVLRETQDTTVGDQSLRQRLGGAKSIPVFPRTRLFLRNDGPPMYSVWIKVRTEIPGVRIEDVRITGAVDDAAPRLTGDPRVNLTVDGYGFYGKDSNGHEALMFHIYRLTGERTFDVSSITGIDSVGHASIVAMSMSPQIRPTNVPLPPDPNAILIAVDVRPPEDFEIRGPWTLATGFHA